MSHQSNYKGIDFQLPEELVAQEPVSPRDSAKLLVYSRADESIRHKKFSDLPDLLQSSTAMVVNETKVDDCRYLFDDGKTEIFVIQKLDDRRVIAMVRPGKRFKLGAEVKLDASLSCVVKAISPDGHRTIEFNVSHDSEALLAHAHVPLPPYIAQDDSLALEYQTVYANNPGSMAAPTAGLHFTDELLTRIGLTHDIIGVDLKVGLGTFASLTEDNFSRERLHEESYTVSPDAAESLLAAKHVTAVGTTSLRTLESIKFDGLPKSGNTDIFIQPGYKFRNTDSLITNFHLPGTSLLLLVEAFIGDRAEMERIYKEAISMKYRFYSFGDAMLIL